MKKVKVCLVLLLVLVFAQQPAKAQIAILEVIKAGVKKVIKAVDLQIQRQQNKVIWLQNAQKTLENTMSKLKLDEITDWVDKQKSLYKDYYEELAKVKSIISYYNRVKELTKMQVELVESYRSAWNLLKKDKHFSATELDEMGRVYSGILDQSVKNIEEISLVLQSFGTTMSDAKRLEIINRAADKVEDNLRDLNEFSTDNKMLSIERAGTEQEASMLKQLYGL